MVYPPGVAIATLTFSNAGTFLGKEASATTMEIVATASVVWAATGAPIDNFSEAVAPGDGMPGSLTVPFVDQAGFVDGAGNAFTMWAYRLTRRSRHGSESKVVTKTWQPIIGQDVIDFDMLPGATIGLPVSTVIPPVTSVAGLTNAVGAEELADALAEFLPDGVTPESVAANLPARLGEAALTATYLAKVEPDEASIRAGILAAAGAGGGTVVVPPKMNGAVWSPITLAASLPLMRGVSVVGTVPVMDANIYGPPGAYMPDFESHFIGGTVFQGDGTFPAFAVNNVDSEVVAQDWGKEQISGATLYGIGFDNFSYAVHAGAKSRMGLVYGKLDELYAINCTQWAFFLTNFQHMDIGVLRVWSCTNGIYLAASVVPAILIPGNSQARELFVKVKYQGGGTTNKSRGIVIGTYGVTDGDVGGLDVDKLQVNAFNRALQTVVMTFTGGSTNVSVPDGNVFGPNMPIQFSTTGNGFTAGKIYFVRTIVGNVVTLSDSHFGAIITPNASGTLTAQTRGYPNLELLGPRSSHLHDVDVEGQSTVGVYAEDLKQVGISVATLPVDCLVGLVSRRSTHTAWDVMQPGAATDFDSASADGSTFTGQRGATYGRPLQGYWKDGVTGTTGLNVGAGADGNSNPDLQVRQNGFLYPAYAGLGEHIYQRDTSRTLDGAVVGNIIFTNNTDATFTLPEVKTALTPLTSIVGAWYNICNVGTGTVTLTTSAGQLFNRAAGKTSLTVLPGKSLKVIASQDTLLYWLALPGTMA